MDNFRRRDKYCLSDRLKDKYRRTERKTDRYRQIDKEGKQVKRNKINIKISKQANWKIYRQIAKHAQTDKHG